ncbi:MAG: hypothetical protein NTW50_01380 [Candidatus Berkelbacteria bacterium]|nr:hypothetical protein [Candidatus Berkelbacteria bacterium]
MSLTAWEIIYVTLIIQAALGSVILIGLFVLNRIFEKRVQQGKFDDSYFRAEPLIFRLWSNEEKIGRVKKVLLYYVFIIILILICLNWTSIILSNIALFGLSSGIVLMQYSKYRWMQRIALFVTIASFFLAITLLTAPFTHLLDKWAAVAEQRVTLPFSD